MAAAGTPAKPAFATTPFKAVATAGLGIVSAMMPSAGNRFFEPFLFFCNCCAAEATAATVASGSSAAASGERSSEEIIGTLGGSVNTLLFSRFSLTLAARVTTIAAAVNLGMLDS